MSISLKRYNANPSPESKKQCRAANRVPPQPLALSSKKADQRSTTVPHSNKPQPFVPKKEIIQEQNPPVSKLQDDQRQEMNETFIAKSMEETTANIDTFLQVPQPAQKQLFVSKAVPHVPATIKPVSFVPRAVPSSAPQPFRPKLVQQIPQAQSAVPTDTPVPFEPAGQPATAKSQLIHEPTLARPASASTPVPFRSIPHAQPMSSSRSKSIPVAGTDCVSRNTVSEPSPTKPAAAPVSKSLPQSRPQAFKPKASPPTPSPVNTKPKPFEPTSSSSLAPKAFIPKKELAPQGKKCEYPDFDIDGWTDDFFQEDGASYADLADLAMATSPYLTPPAAPKTKEPPTVVAKPLLPAPTVVAKPLLPVRNKPIPFSNISPPAQPTAMRVPVPVPAPEPEPQICDPLQDFPPSVKQAYCKRGIKNMYDWQKEVLGLPSVKAGGNLVFSLPTSGGKSLVAEVLLLRAILNKTSGILVMPYVALVDEKVDALEPFTKLLGFEVSSSAGSNSQVPLPGTRFLSICTIEKANALINTMITSGRAQEIGCIVVDELHMVGEQGRGHVLELLLTKVMSVAPTCQLVGMSATVPNLPTLAKWLRAELYESDFRPVSLKQYLMVKTKDGSEQQEADETVFRTISARQDDDSIALLVNEVIPKCCCLVFCTSKFYCEKTCKLLANKVNPEAAQHKSVQRNMLLRDLRGAASGTIDNDLETSILAGVAYHHAGLTSEERRLIETAFRERVINIICCTSTLAAGVNLPARRVIIRYPKTGPVFLTKSRYLQMCGRAGRAGLDDFGESFLFSMDRDLSKSRALMNMPIESLGSKSGTNEAAERAILDVIATEIATTKPAVLAFMEKMLVSVESPESCQSYAALCSEKLEALKVCRIVTNKNEMSQQDDDSELVCTSFGASAFKSGFTSNEALKLKEELREMMQTGLILAHDLHMLYYLTPIRDIWEWRMNWGVYVQVLEKACPLVRKISVMIGLNEGFILHKAAMQSKSDGNKSNPEEYISRRFWLALMLSELLAEVPLDKVAKKYAADRGQLQSLQSNSALFCSMMVGFTESMGWTSLQVTIQSYVKRLDCGVRADCAHLTEIRGVQAGRARSLWNAGYKDIQKIAQADPDTLHARVKQSGTRGGKENMAVKFFSLSVATLVVSEAKVLFNLHLEQKRKELELLEQSTKTPTLS